jgi:DNA primase
MQTSAKYLIHATVRTSGVVERSDVVGAIFGQTEGLLGDNLDLRELQESSKLGRIDVDIDSEGGRSVGSITIASGLDRAETAVLGAALETIDRVGPCRAECIVTSIEDARAAKRRELVDRATELLNELEETTVTSEEIVNEVRKQARVEEITEYKGLPAGPRVASSDAIILVEGRADVRRLLKFGIRNALAVEGTDVPAEIAELTFERNTTAFLDGDRGGDLILRELQQVGDIDYVAFAPTDQSVEDLDRTGILSALRRKVPLEQVADGETPREVFGPTDTPVEPVEKTSSEGEAPGATSDGGDAVASGHTEKATIDESTPPQDDSPSHKSEGEPEEQIQTDSSAAVAESMTTASSEGATTSEDPDGNETVASVESSEPQTDDPSVEVEEEDGDSTPIAESNSPQTIVGHTESVIGKSQELVRLLDAEFDIIEEGDAIDAFEILDGVDTVPPSIILDGTLTQRLLDLAAQRGVGQVIARDTGEFVKKPTDVRVRTADQLEANA